TNLNFTPITSPSALPRSASMPTTVCPSGAMNSLGAYSASDATVIVPFFFTAAGTSAATLLFSPALTFEVVELFLLLPQPASAAAATTATATAAAPGRGIWIVIHIPPVNAKFGASENTPDAARALLGLELLADERLRER